MSSQINNRSTYMNTYAVTQKGSAAMEYAEPITLANYRQATTSHEHEIEKLEDEFEIEKNTNKRCKSVRARLKEFFLDHTGLLIGILVTAAAEAVILWSQLAISMGDPWRVIPLVAGLSTASIIAGHLTGNTHKQITQQMPFSFAPFLAAGVAMLGLAVSTVFYYRYVFLTGTPVSAGAGIAGAASGANGANAEGIAQLYMFLALSVTAFIVSWYASYKKCDPLGNAVRDEQETVDRLGRLSCAVEGLGIALHEQGSLEHFKEAADEQYKAGESKHQAVVAGLARDARILVATRLGDPNVTAQLRQKDAGMKRPWEIDLPKPAAIIHFDSGNQIGSTQSGAGVQAA